MGENADVDNSDICICIRKMRIIVLGIRICILLLLSSSTQLMRLLYVTCI
jgi:hypothetical protein